MALRYRLVALCLAAVMLALCAGACAEPTAQSDRMIEISSDIARQLTKFCAADPYELYGGLPEVKKILDDWAGNWADSGYVRAAATGLNLKNIDTAVTLLQLGGALPKALTVSRSKLYQTLATMPVTALNAQGGPSIIAASAVATMSEVRVLDDFEPGVSYALLDYGDAHPLVMVSFYVADDHAALITGGFAQRNELLLGVLDCAREGRSLGSLIADYSEGLDQTAQMLISSAVDAISGAELVYYDGTAGMAE